MIKMLFKFTLTFIFSFFILSFNINNKPIFYHFSQIAGPVGTDIQSTLSKSMSHSVRKSKELGKQLFNNSKPKYMNDTIKNRQSALKKEREKRRNKHLIQEELRHSERMKLDQLIQSN